MKREFLEKFELEKDVIDKIMAEHGNSINSLKEDLKVMTTDRDNLKGQLETANGKIEEFKSLDIEAIKKSADDYKQQLETATEQHQAEIKKIKVDNALSRAITKSGGLNETAIKALITLKEENELQEDGNIKGLDEIISSLKEAENSKMLFSDYVPDGQGNNPGGDGNNNDDDSFERSVMGLKTKN